MKFNFNKSTFVKKIWQKKPVLYKNGINKFKDNLTFEKIKKIVNNNKYEKKLFIKKLRKSIEINPSYTNLINHESSLLFYKSNHFHELSFNLINLINFIPKYLIDDVMISHSSINGSVGKHKDNYSVFLIQGNGIKRWRIFFENKILDFETTEGDVLYIPPGIYHHGISQSNFCNTYSLGFRSPDSMSIQENFNDVIFEKLEDQDTIFFKNSIFPKNSYSTSKDVNFFFNNSLNYKDYLQNEFIGNYLSFTDLKLFKKKNISFKNFTSYTKKYKLFINQRTRSVFHNDHIFMNGHKLVLEDNFYKDMLNFIISSEMEINRISEVNLRLLYSLFKKNYIVFRRQFNF